jgi:hypothetical protein
MNNINLGRIIFQQFYVVKCQVEETSLCLKSQFFSRGKDIFET